jgi:hypothetical protein
MAILLWQGCDRPCYYSAALAAGPSPMMAMRACSRPRIIAGCTCQPLTLPMQALALAHQTLGEDYCPSSLAQTGVDWVWT